MDEHVILQIARLSETFETDVTLMRFFTRMDERVILQAPLSSERLFADVTRIHRSLVDALTLTRPRIT